MPAGPEYVPALHEIQTADEDPPAARKMGVTRQLRSARNFVILPAHCTEFYCVASATKGDTAERNDGFLFFHAEKQSMLCLQISILDLILRM